MEWTPMIFWIIVALGALAVDIATSAFLFIWFAVGAIAAIISIAFNAPVGVQAIFFVAVSAASTAVGYPIVTKNIKKTVSKI